MIVIAHYCYTFSYKQLLYSATVDNTIVCDRAQEANFEVVDSPTSAPEAKPMNKISIDRHAIRIKTATNLNTKKMLIRKIVRIGYQNDDVSSNE